MKSELPPLYTQEMAVFREGLEKVDMANPITVIIDVAGNHLLQHGNHRAMRAEITGEPLERVVIGSSPINASENPNYRLIAEMVFIER